MNLQTFILLAVLLSFSSAAPILRQTLGLIASNSNEIVRLPEFTPIQAPQFLSPFLIQTQPDFLLPPQVLNFGPQVPGPFLPPQQNLPSFQQEQLTGAINPNYPPLTNQDPSQVVPQYFPFPLTPGGQGFPYYLSYSFLPRNTMPNLPPNQNTASQNVANQNPAGPTNIPQPVQNNGNVMEPWRMTPPLITVAIVLGVL